MELYEKISAWIDAREQDMLRDISRLVAIKSVKGEPEEDAPFGKGPRDALHEGLEICREHGLITKNHDNVVGTADIGENPPALDILVHLDTVDADGGWDTDPFEAVLKGDGCVYGRGTDDDKGPCVMAVYAMECVTALGLPLSKNARLIMGTNEESGNGEDLACYYEKEKYAPHTVSPDAAFPVYNTEKGLYRPELGASWGRADVRPRVTAFSGGDKLNVIPDSASAEIVGMSEGDVRAACAPLAERLGAELSAEERPGGVKIGVKGRCAHASMPEKGNNALTALISLLVSLPLKDCPSTSALGALAEIFPHGDFYGKGAGIAMSDGVSGKLTAAFTMMRLSEEGLSAKLDCRVPLCATEENCSKVLEERVRAFGFAVSGKMNPAHHTPEDSPFIRTLLGSYERYTGLRGKCRSMGGITYVHGVPGGVVFGAAQEGFESNLHAANERMRVKDLLTAAKIYAAVIAEVCR